MLAPGSILQTRYRIVRQLGVGGMGTVYEAIDGRFESRVAIKEAHYAEPELRNQFAQEARLLYLLRHRALARVIDHFIEQDSQFLVMDFVDGDDLGAILEHTRTPFPLGQVLDWAYQLLDALDYLHSRDPAIIHRDIKPHNLKVLPDGQVILLDFGLAKLSQYQTTYRRSIFGYSPTYAPIEQVQGSGTDARSDIYSAAATFYHLLTGKVPADVLSRVMATSNSEMDPLIPADGLNPNVPTQVALVLQQAMMIGRSQRLSTVKEFSERLRASDPRRNEISQEKVRASQQQTIAAATLPVMTSDYSLSRVPPAPTTPTLPIFGPEYSTSKVPPAMVFEERPKRFLFASIIALVFLSIAVVGIVILASFGNQRNLSNQRTINGAALPNANARSSQTRETVSASPSNVSTPLNANVADVRVAKIYMARDDYGVPGVRTSSFSPSDRTIHCIIELNKAKKGTEVRFTWKAMDVVGAFNEEIKTIYYTTQEFENKVRGHLTFPKDWPTGKYRVEVYINGDLDKTIDYTME
jgi:serine/threonine protein kinase